MGKVKKNYNYVLSFLILTIMIVLGMTSNPTKIYADENGDWHYYQDEDKDASTFEEMLDIEWKQLNKQTNNNPSVSEEDFKSSRVKDLKKRIIIKYTLLQPDKYGRTVIYKDYSLSSTVGTGADYGEVFNYETDWESNVEKVEVWLPSTVNDQAPAIKNPKKEYKDGGYGGNYCLAWAGQFYNTLESQEERAIFPSNGFGVYSGIGYWNNEHPIGSGAWDWQPNLYNVDFSYQNWNHYDPKERMSFTFNYRDENGNIIEFNDKI